MQLPQQIANYIQVLRSIHYDNSKVKHFAQYLGGYTPLDDVSHLYRTIEAYVAFFDLARPLQGIAQQSAERMGIAREEKREGKTLSFPVLNGPHHDYRRAA